MHNGDVLGDEGRKALNACVKVKIIGKPETRCYDIDAALKRLEGCYADFYRFSGLFNYQYEVKRRVLHQLFLPATFDECRYASTTGTYNIVDIHSALVNSDERSYVEKYPKEGPGSDKLKDVIDKRRADVERELEEAKADPDGRHKYSWVVAQRRVRDCFAGNFPEDQYALWRKIYERRIRERRCKKKLSCNIIDIYESVVHWDKERERADAQRAALEKEHAEAAAAPDTYSKHEAECRVENCLPIAIYVRDIFPSKMLDENEMPATAPIYDISDIHKAVLQFGGKLLEKYPEEGPGSDELKELIDEHRTDLKQEYQKATCDTGSQPSLHEYSWSDAERRVRDCFAGTYPGETEIFPNMKKDENDQTYDIFDIKQAIDHFDAKTFVDAFKYESEGEPRYDESKQEVDEQRADIQKEYEAAMSSTEIEHGSGFIVHNHFIITNKHVIDTYLNETKSHEIRISNAAIDKLVCKVAHYDAGKDLAILYCPDLNLAQGGICPLQLSNQPLLPGMSIFSFGYPVSHTGEAALFVSGNVSGSKETLACHSMLVLNCSLNSGNSGGPILCWVKGQLRVVGVATQKHIKEILTLEERETIEHIRESFQTHAIPDVPDHFRKVDSFTYQYSMDPQSRQIPMFLLTLKLYDALETHSQFNLSNALPGDVVVDFINDSVSKYTGEYKDELAEIIKLSEDRVNILPSGHLSTQCCIQ